MPIKITINKPLNYLLYSAPPPVNLERIKARRRRLNSILRASKIERMLFDLSAVDNYKIIEADTLARDFHADIPSCKKLAVVHRTTPVMQHYQNVSFCSDGVNVQFFNTLESAEKWLCTEQGDRP